MVAQSGRCLDDVADDHVPVVLVAGAYEHAGGSGDTAGEARVLQRPPGGLGKVALLRVDPLRLGRREAEESGVEIGEPVDEPGLPQVDGARPALRAVVRLQVPALLGHLAQAVLARHEDVPEFVGAAGVGEDAVHADDGDVVPVVLDVLGAACGTPLAGARAVRAGRGGGWSGLWRLGRHLGRHFGRRPGVGGAGCPVRGSGGHAVDVAQFGGEPLDRAHLQDEGDGDVDVEPGLDVLGERNGEQGVEALLLERSVGLHGVGLQLQCLGHPAGQHRVEVFPGGAGLDRAVPVEAPGRGGGGTGRARRDRAGPLRRGGVGCVAFRGRGRDRAGGRRGEPLPGDPVCLQDRGRAVEDDEAAGEQAGAGRRVAVTAGVDADGGGERPEDREPLHGEGDVEPVRSARGEGDLERAVDQPGVQGPGRRASGAQVAGGDTGPGGQRGDGAEAGAVPQSPAGESLVHGVEVDGGAGGAGGVRHGQRRRLGGGHVAIADQGARGVVEADGGAVVLGRHPGVALDGCPEGEVAQAEPVLAEELGDPAGVGGAGKGRRAEDQVLGGLGLFAPRPYGAAGRRLGTGGGCLGGLQPEVALLVRCRREAHGCAAGWRRERCAGGELAGRGVQPLAGRPGGHLHLRQPLVPGGRAGVEGSRPAHPGQEEPQLVLQLFGAVHDAGEAVRGGGAAQTRLAQGTQGRAVGGVQHQQEPPRQRAQRFGRVGRQGQQARPVAVRRRRVRGGLDHDVRVGAAEAEAADARDARALPGHRPVGDEQG
ncbi:hypothetical protein EES44_15265 [Streptomyces sp. ADI96-15]|nr:hypothetical protein EES44_15265 [Streptomyces sp. ADI96-15]